MITLGIDQSYTKCAIVIMKNGDMVDFFTLTSNKKEDWFFRCWEITTQVVNVFKEKKPQKIAIEGLAFASKGDQTRNLGGLQFCIVSQLRFVQRADIEVIAPNTLKKFATGYGRCGKEEMIKALPNHILQQFKDKNYKKTTGLHDLADAYWLAKKCYLDLKGK